MRRNSLTLATLLGIGCATGCGNNPLNSVFGDINLDDVYLNVGQTANPDEINLSQENLNYATQMLIGIVDNAIDVKITGMLLRKSLGNIILYNENKIVDSTAVPLDRVSVEAIFYSKFPAGQ